MKKPLVFPDMFFYRFIISVVFFGRESEVTVAFDNPDDVFVFLNDGDFHITYELRPDELERITKIAHDMMEQL